MKREGQRQEVMYLGVAAAVLLCGLAGVLAARALANRPRPEPPAPVAQASASRTRKAVTTKSNAATSTHNPFATLAGPGGGVAPPPRRRILTNQTDPREARAGRPGRDDRPLQPEVDLQLLGIMRGGNAMAVIRDGEDRHYLRLGDTVADYRITKIGMDSVTLSRGAETVTLTMHQEKRDRRRARTARR